MALAKALAIDCQTREETRVDADPTDVARVTTADADATAAALETARASEITLRDRAAQAIANLENAYGAWGASSNVYTAQKDAALKLTIRVVVAIARLTLRKLEAAP